MRLRGRSSLGFCGDWEKREKSYTNRSAILTIDNHIEESTGKRCAKTSKPLVRGVDAGGGVVEELDEIERCKKKSSMRNSFSSQQMSNEFAIRKRQRDI